MSQSFDFIPDDEEHPDTETLAQRAIFRTSGRRPHLRSTLPPFELSAALDIVRRESILEHYEDFDRTIARRNLNQRIWWWLAFASTALMTLVFITLLIAQVPQSATFLTGVVGAVCIIGCVAYANRERCAEQSVRQRARAYLNKLVDAGRASTDM